MNGFGSGATGWLLAALPLRAIASLLRGERRPASVLQVQDTHSGAVGDGPGEFIEAAGVSVPGVPLRGPVGERVVAKSAHLRFRLTAKTAPASLLLLSPPNLLRRASIGSLLGGLCLESKHRAASWPDKGIHGRASISATERKSHLPRVCSHK